MAVIVIGLDAIDRPSQTLNTSITYVCRQGAAASNGKITQVQIWAKTNLVLCEVATFYEETPAGNLTTRDSQAIGNVTAGSVQTFAVDLDVVAGDFLGIYYAMGQLEADTGGAAGRYLEGDYIPCTNEAFNESTSYRKLSLYGTGIEAPAITSLTPDSGPVDEEVIIDGTDFEDTQGTGGVTVDGIPADIVSWTDTEIIITIPAGVACGDVNVIVTTAHGQISNAFTLNVECPSRRSVLQLPPIGWPIGGGLGRPPIMG